MHCRKNLCLDFLFFLLINTNTQTIHKVWESILLTLWITSHDLLNKLCSRAKVQLFPKFFCSQNDLPLKILYRLQRMHYIHKVVYIFYKCVSVHVYVDMSVSVVSQCLTNIVSRYYAWKRGKRERTNGRMKRQKKGMSRIARNDFCFLPLSFKVSLRCRCW